MRRIKFKTVLELKYQALETEPCSSNPGSSKSGCFRCNKSQCVTCDIITECQNFISATTGEIFSINSKMNCDSKNLIYLYSCKLCRHQYVGETNQTLRERANGHRYEIIRKNKDHPLYSHLLNFHFPDPYDNHDDDNDRDCIHLPECTENEMPCAVVSWRKQWSFLQWTERNKITLNSAWVGIISHFSRAIKKCFCPEGNRNPGMHFAHFPVSRKWPRANIAGVRV